MNSKLFSLMLVFATILTGCGQVESDTTTDDQDVDTVETEDTNGYEAADDVPASSGVKPYEPSGDVPTSSGVK